jgi:hypothetical protein
VKDLSGVLVFMTLTQRSEGRVLELTMSALDITFGPLRHADTALAQQSIPPSCQLFPLVQSTVTTFGMFCDTGRNLQGVLHHCR